MNKIACRKSKYKDMNHQSKAMDKIKDIEFFALFMEQGTGKSKVVLNQARNLYDKGLIDRMVVMVPTSLRKQWSTEVLEDHSTLEYRSFVYRGMNTQKEKEEFKALLNIKDVFKVFIVHYEAFNTKGIDAFMIMFLQDGYPLIISDESTKIKNPEAARTKKIVTKYRKRLYKGIMTGTPTPNSPLDLYSQFDFLKKGFWQMPYWQFKRTYCIMITKMNPNTGRPFNVPIDEETWKKIHSIIDNNIANRIRIGKQFDTKPIREDFELVAYKENMQFADVMTAYNQEEYTPYKNLSELKNKIEPYTFTFAKSEGMDLPEKVYQRLDVELSAEQKKLIKQLKNHMVAEFQGNLLTTTNALGVIGRIQMIAGGLFPFQNLNTLPNGEIDTEVKYQRLNKNPKLDAFCEDLETNGKDIKIIVWARFTEELRWAYEEATKLKYDCGLYIGETKQTERDYLEDSFKKGNLQILFLSPQLGEMGLDFYMSTLHYFLSNGYEGDRRLQQEGRSHRKGLKSCLTLKDIVAEGTKDLEILQILKRKEDLIKYFRNDPEFIYHIGG